jgi:asparagine synthase (glutamine-hydrolysing)
VITSSKNLLRRFYRIDCRRESHTNDEETIEEFRSLLQGAVGSHLVADVAVGSCLSGGLDSSSIVGLVHRLRRGGGSQLTFSSVFGDDGPWDETSFVDSVLRSVPATAIRVTPDLERLRADLASLVWHQDEPVGGLSVFAQWCVMSAARDHGVRVLLDGQGADEVLAGYRPYTTFLAELLRRGLMRRLIAEARAASRFDRSRSAVAIGRAAARQLPLELQRPIRIRRSRRRSAATLLHPDLARRVQRCAGSTPVAEDRCDLSETLRFQIEEQILPALLRYEDRNSMAHAVEARVPYLDHRLVDFAFSRGADLRLRDGWGKWLLRRAVEPVLPPEVTWRSDKVGFAVPDTRWVDALLHEPSFHLSSSDPLTEYVTLPLKLTDNGGGPHDRTSAQALWRCLNVSLWLRTFAAASSDAPVRGRMEN